MRSSSHALVVLLVVAPAIAGAGAPEGDQARLQGTWKAGNAPEDRAITLEIKGRTLTVSFTSPQGEAHTARAEIKLDEDAMPKAMDWVQVVRDGQDAPDVAAIYDLQGDTLTIRARRRPPHQRPTEFLADPRAGAGDQMVFRRRPDESNPHAPK